MTALPGLMFQHSVKMVVNQQACCNPVLLVQAISASMSEGDLTATSCTVGVVGADTKFLILSEADLEPYVTAMKDAEDAPAGLSCLSVLTDHEQDNTTQLCTS